MRAYLILTEPTWIRRALLHHSGVVQAVRHDDHLEHVASVAQEDFVNSDCNWRLGHIRSLGEKLRLLAGESVGLSQWTLY
jgi:hypothetical protein